MRHTESSTNAPCEETSALPHLSREETAVLGKEIYERDIRRLVEDDHKGEVVAIDLGSGSYALGKDAIAASERLRRQNPGAHVWLMRVGHRALYRFGGSSLRRLG